MRPSKPVRKTKRTQPSPTAQRRTHRSRGPFPLAVMVLGVSLCATFLGGLTAWGALSPISGAVIAAGVVSVESYRKTVQHLEGGIVAAIRVNDGDRVAAGDVLVDVRDVAVTANVDRLQTEYFESLAAGARLTAERDSAAEIAFPVPLTDSKDKMAAAAMASQLKVFASRRELARQTVSVIDKKVGQLAEEMKGYRGRITSVEKQAKLVAEQKADAEILFDKKLMRKSRFLDLQARQAELEGQRSGLVSEIARAEQEILELELKKKEVLAATAAAVTAELREVDARSYQLSRELAAARDVLVRTQVRSPIAGTVVNLQVHSIGGVISAGQTLMEIVPENDALIVEARIRPEDIEVVRPGLDANVVLATLNRRYTQPLAGTLDSVSADRLTDPLTGMGYYLARITLDKASVTVQGQTLLAGMGADVFIKTGERTVLDYIAAPVVRTFMRGMREN
ncbi:MAG: HlyD family type I secretion periplasmic adaptor subunit [Hyphomicrobiaceae bacterium]|nr:HlyD family type I secretion periplasmic adaptor subunit [Hyphomicrobiaceae bacterium]